MDEIVAIILCLLCEGAILHGLPELSSLVKRNKWLKENDKYAVVKYVPVDRRKRIEIAKNSCVEESVR